MNKEDIIKEYKNYCSDLDLDFKKISSRNKFTGDYLKHLYNLGIITRYKWSIAEVQDYIKSILKGVN